MKILRITKKKYLLVAILLVSAILRFVAVKPGYNPYHGDETAIWGSASVMVKEDTLDPGRYDYPGTAATINAFFYKFVFIPLSWTKFTLSNFWDIVDGKIKIPLIEKEKDKIFATQIIGEREINSLFWSRYITAAFGVGTVFLIYLLGKKMFSEDIGLLTSLFLAFNYKNVVNSHLVLPDIYNAFFFILAMIAFWNLYKNSSAKNYLLAGIAAGISFSVKYQSFVFLPLLLIHLAISFKNGFSLKKLFGIYAIVSAFSIILIFLITNPYFFINIEYVFTKMNEEFIKYGMGTNTLNLFPYSYLYHIDYGPVLSFIVILGTLSAVFKDKFKSVFLLSAIVPAFYLFIYYSRGGFYIRNFIPLTPFLFLFASNLICTTKLKKWFISIPLIILAIYIPAKNSIISSYWYTKPWGYEILSKWLKDHIPNDAKIASHPFDRSILAVKTKTTEFSPNEAFSLMEHKENGAEYVVENLAWASLPFYFWMNYNLNEVNILWNKPVDIMRNTFHGLAAEEMLRYMIFANDRSWQSPDMFFVMVKLPDWPKTEMKEIAKFDFNQNYQDWKNYGGSGQAKFTYENDMISFSPGGERYPNVRITSPLINIKSGHLYNIEGFIKTEKILNSKEREGFLRIDFWTDNPDLNKTGIISSVSSRVYGTDNWIKKEIFERAPENAKYLTVSFQVYSTSVTKILFDNISIKESFSPVENITKKEPYINKKIDLNFLYPNSHGNL